MSEQKINAFVHKQIDAAFLDDLARARSYGGVTAQDVQNALGIFRSNASASLNALAKKGKLIKIESRPVYFLPTDLLTHYLSRDSLATSYTPKEFIALFSPAQDFTDEEPFSILVGHSASLAEQVEQAKAAMLYPPHGLHTLIIGESGTGKTLFSHAMHNYALAALGKTESDLPYVAFNCADYYHNPQLLMSHLFGYVKGAFTGANEETDGVVEMANGGILFLDEIHRLPPEGQELLFYLMDTGHYRKLGETATLRSARVLIIGATTENPQNVLLKTFIRRIPVTINLPAYRDKPIEEKLQLIETFFANESTAIQKTFHIKPPVIKSLAAYDYPGNLGQLASEIKVLCARTYLDNSSKNGELVIYHKHLSPLISQAYAQLHPYEIYFPPHYDYDITIAPASDIRYTTLQSFSEKNYQAFLEKLKKYTSQGYTKKELDEAMAEGIHEYYRGVLQSFSHHQINRQEMYKAVNSDIVDFTINVMRQAAEPLEISISQKNILIMAFHIQYLLERIKKGEELEERETNPESARREYAHEFAAAQQIAGQINSTYGTVISFKEIYLIAVLLANLHNEETDTQEQRGLYILAHGNSTATSIADVCNRLMNCNYAIGIDAPLEQSVEETYRLLLNILKRQPAKSDALLLADMGSLLHLGDRAAADTGRRIFTLPNVTTLTALDITRMLCKGSSVENIYIEYAPKMSPGVCPPAHNKCAILTVCASGVGTSRAFKLELEKELEKANLPDIAVIAMNYLDVKERTPTYQSANRKYTIVACVGNVDCKLGIPFYHISKLLAESDKQEFIKMVRSLAGSVSHAAPPVSKEEEHQAECLRFLEKNVTYLNPKLAVHYSAQFLHALNLPQMENDTSLKLSLTLHLGFMLERIIAGQHILFDEQDTFIQKNRPVYQQLRTHIHILENAFSLSVSDAEICYIIRAICGDE